MFTLSQHMFEVDVQFRHCQLVSLHDISNYDLVMTERLWDDSYKVDSKSSTIILEISRGLYWTAIEPGTRP